MLTISQYLFLMRAAVRPGVQLQEDCHDRTVLAGLHLVAPTLTGWVVTDKGRDEVSRISEQFCDLYSDLGFNYTRG